MSFVYFIREGEDGPIKIGVSSSPAHRLQSLQAGNPRRLTLIAAVEYIAKDVPGQHRSIRFYEDYWHKAFADDRIGDTEWFSPSARLLEELSTLVAEGEPFIAPGIARGAVIVPLSLEAFR